MKRKNQQERISYSLLNEKKRKETVKNFKVDKIEINNLFNEDFYFKFNIEIILKNCYFKKLYLNNYSKNVILQILNLKGIKCLKYLNNNYFNKINNENELLNKISILLKVKNKKNLIFKIIENENEFINYLKNNFTKDFITKFIQIFSNFLYLELNDFLDYCKSSIITRNEYALFNLNKYNFINLEYLSTFTKEISKYSIQFKNENKLTLQSIPIDLHLIILSKINDFTMLLKCRLICKYWNYLICKNNYIWKELTLFYCKKYDWIFENINFLNENNFIQFIKSNNNLNDGYCYSIFRKNIWPIVLQYEELNNFCNSIPTSHLQIFLTKLKLFTFWKCIKSDKLISNWNKKELLIDVKEIPFFEHLNNLIFKLKINKKEISSFHFLKELNDLQQVERDSKLLFYTKLSSDFSIENKKIYLEEVNNLFDIYEDNYFDFNSMSYLMIFKQLLEGEDKQNIACCRVQEKQQWLLFNCFFYNIYLSNGYKDKPTIEFNEECESE
ncbi:hypothetical protein ABK040_010782 [Willaertia magna]